ncbi:beta transducin-like protein het-e4s, partial [Lasallia pustulata]
MAEAEAMYRRALEGSEKASGAGAHVDAGHGPQPGESLQESGQDGGSGSHVSTGMAEAEAMYRQALEGLEKAWGPEHTSTLGTVHHLAVLYADQGKMAEAEAMYRRALEGSEKAWGPEHTSTLGTVHNLGNLYKDQGKMAEAEA